MDDIAPAAAASPAAVSAPPREEGLRAALARGWRALLLDHFEGMFVIVTLLLLGGILYFVNQKLSLLNLYFVPVLVAGMYMDARRAVLGGMLAVAWVAFFAVIDPHSFSQDMGSTGLYLHLLSWGSLLILTGAITGRMNEKLRERWMTAASALEETTKLREDLSRANARLEEKNLTLEVTKAKVEAVLYASMDPHVAKLIIDRRLRNEKRPVSVLFADLAEFTRRSEESPPESVIEDLNRLYGELEPVVTRFRGHVDKYLGDGLMVEFGVPLPNDHHPLMAVLSAVSIQKRMAERRYPWKMRIGVASGSALIGLVGSEHRKNFTAIGDPVNLASRLQSLCPHGSVCVDEATHEAVRRFFRTRRMRDGMTAEEASQLEARLELVTDALEGAPTARLAMEAADVASRLGDMAAAVKWHRRALELDPGLRQPIERAITAALLSGPDRDVAVKGKRDRQAVYEVLGLKDPLEDSARIPSGAVEVFRRLSKEVWLAEEQILSVEAAGGALGHAPVVAALSGALAELAGLGDRSAKECFTAGYLHDIGKRSLPDFLLSREDTAEGLPPTDQAMLRGHVTEAERVIGEWGLPRSAELLEAILQHHERLDGSGYPHGLKDKQIGVPGRILALADSYDEMTSWRPHREPVTARAALAELRREAAEGRLDGPLVERLAVLLAPIV